MTSTSTVSIHVTDRPTGLPVARAHVGVFLVRDAVDAQSDRRATLLHGTTDETGRCEVRAELAADERVRVCPVVRAAGHSEWKPWFGRDRVKDTGREVPDDPLLTAGGSVRVDVALERGPTIAGTVTDPSGKAVADAGVGLVLSMARGCCWPHAFAIHTVHWPPPCHTDADGRFEWLSFRIGAAVELEGHFVLLVEHGGFAQAMVHSVEELPPDENGVIRVDVRLETGCTLEGEVLLPDGSPASGATVESTARQEADQPACVSFEKSVTTDAAGRFVLRGLKSTVHMLNVERSGCAAYSTAIDLTPGAVPPCRIQLVGGQDLAGQILDRRGDPIADALVVALLGEPAVIRKTQTDAEGRFVVAGLPTTGDVVIRCPPHVVATVPLPSAPLVLRVPNPVDIRVELVADESGEPLGTEGHVTAFGPGFSTILEPGAGGGFHRSDTPAGRYEFWADVPDRAVASCEVDVTEDGLLAPIVIRVPRGGVVHGSATDAAGRPIAGVDVTAFGASSMHPRSGKTDESGTYEVRGLGEWAYLVVTREGLAMHVRRLRPTGSVEAPVVVDVVLGEGATIRGRVARADGSPVVRARVVVVMAGHERLPVQMPSAMTDAAGRFVLQHVPDVDVIVGTGNAKASVCARHGQTFDVELHVV